jgi:hypothetical protein
MAVRPPMPVPQMIETPTMRRSAMLAKLLEEQRQPVEIKGGYGELAARLLGQGITQFSANRAERAVRDEREALDSATRQRIADVLGTNDASVSAAPSVPFAAALTNTEQPVEAMTAPVATVAGSPMPPAAPAGMSAPMPPMADVPPMPQMVPPVQMVPQAPQQGGIPRALASVIRQRMDAGDLAGAQTMLNNYQSQQAAMEMLPPEVRNDPMMAWLAATNPDEFTKAVSQQYSPQVVAEGGAQRIAGLNQTYRNPRTFLAGGDIMQTAESGVRDVGDVSPTYSDQTARMVAERPQVVTTGEGAVTTFYGPQGEIGGQIQGRERAVPPSPVSTEITGRISAIDTDVMPTIGRMRELLESGDVISGLGAEQRLLAARAAAAIGDQNARRQVAATEEYLNTSGRLRVGMAKSLGANPSNADIALLERVTAGDLNQSVGGLMATINQGEEMATRQRAAAQQQLDASNPAQSVLRDPLEGRTATGPNGERLVRRGGQWVPQ